MRPDNPSLARQGAAHLLGLGAVGVAALLRPGPVVRWLARRFPDVLFHRENAGPLVALTFDDSPHATLTPRLLDLLTVLRARLDTTAPFLVISGYRSPETNAMLHRKSEGVATNSLHMQGQAIDIRVADRSLDALHRTALAVKAGYPKVFATGGPADDLIVDVAVAGQSALVNKSPALERLVSAYFDTVDAQVEDPVAHAAFVTSDCGKDCASDNALGAAVLDSVDFLTLDENACLWFGMCGGSSKILERADRTARLLAAKGKVDARVLPAPAGPCT